MNPKVDMRDHYKNNINIMAHCYAKHLHESPLYVYK